MIEALFLVAMTVRFAAGGLLIVAAIGKATTIRAQVEAHRRAGLVGLSVIEVVAGALLLLPVSGLPSSFAAVLFLGFAVAQAAGRSVGEKRPCGCYGAAAPNAVFSYSAVGTFLLLALAIVGTTVVSLPMSDATQVMTRLLGLAVAAVILGLIRRGSHPLSAPAPIGSTVL